MASPLVDISVGITIAFASSGFTAQILDVNPASPTVDDIQTSHQGTTGGHTFVAADLVDNGEMSFDIHFNPDTTVPVGGANETITITFPAGATESYDGYIKSATPAAPLNDKMTSTITVKVSGDIGRVAG